MTSVASGEAAGAAEGDAAGGEPQPGTGAPPATSQEVSEAIGNLTTDPLAEAIAGTEAAAKAEKANGKPKRGTDLGARLADLSRARREEKIAASRRISETNAQLEAAKSQLASFQSLQAKAKSGDESAIDELYEVFGVNFEQIVKREAGRGEPQTQTPEQQVKAELAAQAKTIAELKERLDGQKAAEAAQAATNVRAQHVAGIIGAIQADPDKFELCARHPQEAAEDVIAEVTKAWQKQGQPKLEAGEFEEAVKVAIEVTEKRYAKRGEDYSSRKGNGAAAANGSAAAAPAARAANGAPKVAPKRTQDFLDSLGDETQLSEKDREIARGLIDKTAPLENSARARPRTISSGLGGSAPPRSAPAGAMDPREALREVTAHLIRQNA